MKLPKHTAVITGASGGIGSAVAHRFAREGYKIVCADTQKSNHTQLVREIEEAGGHCIFIGTDVTSSIEVSNMVNGAIEAFGSVDVLVNAAGIGIRSPFLEITEEMWDETIAVNLKGTSLHAKSSRVDGTHENGGIDYQYIVYLRRGCG